MAEIVGMIVRQPTGAVTCDVPGYTDGKHGWFWDECGQLAHKERPDCVNPQPTYREKRVNVEEPRSTQIESAFLDASIAVWREVDRQFSEDGEYTGIEASTELRKRERTAWERYRDEVLDA